MKSLFTILTLLIILNIASAQNVDGRLVLNNDNSTLTLQMRTINGINLAQNTPISTISMKIIGAENLLDEAPVTSYTLKKVDARGIISMTSSEHPSPDNWISGEYIVVAVYNLIDNGARSNYTANDFSIVPKAGANELNEEPTFSAFDPNLFGQEVLSQNTILPVELTLFSAKKYENKFSQLNWETSSEINNDFFNIERSADGKSFSTLGKVLGNGTTTETQNYEFLDRAPVAGLNYYRLKQVDFNGEYEYSKVETVDFRTGDEGEINIFPNPSVDYVNIELDRAYDGVKVMNQLGQLVENIPATSFENNNIKLNVADYTPGVYYIEAKLDYEIVNKQFVKIK